MRATTVTRMMAIEALHTENAVCPECKHRLTFGCGHEEAIRKLIRNKQDAMRRQRVINEEI